MNFSYLVAINKYFEFQPNCNSFINFNCKFKITPSPEKINERRLTMFSEVRSQMHFKDFKNQKLTGQKNSYNVGLPISGMLRTS